jgi:RND family efflux transporter MFP subunit
MRRAAHPIAHFTLAVAAGLGLLGCAKGPPPPDAAPPAAVSVGLPVERDVTDYNDFSGRIAAVESVQLRARVWGYLRRINFREGAEVQKGDVLFEIDPRVYQAALDQAEANLAQARAHRDRLQSDQQRAAALLAQKAIGQEEYDRVSGDRGEAEAAVKSAEAACAAARLNLEFAFVHAPVSGRVGRAMVTVGNIVQSGEAGGTVLTTLVSIDPVYAYFDVDDLTYLQVSRWARAAAASNGPPPPVFLGLANESGHPHAGALDFVDNQVNPATGTVKMRGLFPNSDRALTPGLFVRVRVPVGSAHRALLVSDRAVDTDQGQKVIYVVGSGDVVEQRPVRLGRLHDGLREVVSGLRAGERVVVGGLQRVRPGAPVEPKLVEMTPAADARPEGAALSPAVVPGKS